MIVAIQQTVQFFANLVVASSLGLSLAIGTAGAFHQHPLDLARYAHPPQASVYAVGSAKLVVARLN